MKKLIFLGICLLWMGCSNPHIPVVVTPPPQEVIATDITGNKYKLISEEVLLSNGVSQAELWEKIDPKNTNYWYIPALGVVRNTNGNMEFKSIRRTQ